MRLFLVLLFVPLLANAEHHRQHVMDRLPLAQEHLDKALFRATNLANSQQWSEPLQGRFDTLFRYAGFVQDDFDEIEIIMTTGGDLRQARRIMTEPGNGPPQSTVKRLLALVNFAAGFLAQPLNQEQMQEVRFAALNFARAWRFSDEMAWHILDAIQEEIYQDPAFICSGPGNHCQ